MHRLLPAALLALVAPAAAQTGAATLPLADAQAMAARALGTARSLGRDVSVVVVNREGRVIVSQRMDDASYLSLDLAQAKASTAAAVGVPTALLEQQVDGGKPSILSVPGVALVAGGLPIRVADRLVGGIGVSGGATEEDVAIATAALGPAR